MSKRILTDEESLLNYLFKFDSLGMKSKAFDVNNKKEKKLVYLNEYSVYQSHPIENHPCYQIVDKLGEGAFGQVYKIRLKATYPKHIQKDLNELFGKDRIFVLKHCQMGMNRDENLNMLREVIANMKLNHDAIIRYFQYWLEYDEHDGKLTINLVMELADENLRDWMSRNEQREYRKVIKMISEISQGLEIIHLNEIVHRDLKPENILLINGVCNISDFGASAISKIKDESNENYLKSIIGTYYYMAPEVITKQPYTNKVDIFSLGLICMELIVKFPSEQESAKAVNCLKDDRTLPEIFSNHFIEEGKLILAMTDRDPDKRPDIIDVITTIGFIERFRNEAEEARKVDKSMNDETFIIEKFREIKEELRDRGITDLALPYFGKIISKNKSFDHSSNYEEKLLKKGRFGDVILQKFENGSSLVLRIIKMTGLSERKIRELLRDVIHINSICLIFQLSSRPELILFFRSHFDIYELTLFTQTDYCQDSLANWMKKNGDRIDNLNETRIETAFGFFIDILEALMLLRSINVVHRDLKPSNIFLAFDKRWKISDCGLSYLRLMEYECEQDYYQSLIQKGVPVYAAPEQVNHSISNSSNYQEHTSFYKIDIFSVGLIMCEYLNPSFSNEDFLSKELENMRNFHRFPESMDLSLFENSLYELVLGMTETNPNQRLDLSQVWGNFIQLKGFKQIEQMKDVNQYEDHVASPIRDKKEIFQKYYANGLQNVTNDLKYLDENVGYNSIKYEINIFSELQLKQLQHLDLSNCRLIDHGEALIQLNCLKTLIFYNCPRLDLSLESIVKIESLRFLDISSSYIENDRYGYRYKEPIIQLEMICTCLVNLTHLDISGTNLAVINPRTNEIEGLSLLPSPLEFLGIYKNEIPDSVKNIPAKMIAGNADVCQIVTACEVFIDKIYFLYCAIVDLWTLFKSEKVAITDANIDRALRVILLSMSRHKKHDWILISSSAALCGIMKYLKCIHSINLVIDQQVIEQIISCLIDSMMMHKNNYEIMRNCLRALIYMELPEDVIHEYSRLMEILFYVIKEEELVELRVECLNILYFLVRYEKLISHSESINILLKMIKYFREKNNDEDILKINDSWIIICYINDENPINCERFLIDKGLDEFMACYNRYAADEHLVALMLTVISNISEWAHLRQYLIRKDYIEIFMHLSNDQYIASSILAHIASSGPQFWEKLMKEDLSRDEMLARLETSISSWEIDRKLNVILSSLNPLLSLLGSDQEYQEAQHWAVWSLANLTRADCSKYCSLLEKEGGIDIVNHLIKLTTNDKIKFLAQIIIIELNKFKGDLNLK